uniref:ATP-dependent DNA helicase n=1 Tax=Parastrongyloides trichosuri TaxID=131310 RepID=A0A0N5A032_PARTI
MEGNINKFGDVKKIMLCRSSNNEMSFKIKRITKLAAYFNLELNVEFNDTELEMKYDEVNNFYKNNVLNQGLNDNQDCFMLRQFLIENLNIKNTSLLINNTVDITLNNTIENDNVVYERRTQIVSNNQMLLNAEIADNEEIDDNESEMMEVDYLPSQQSSFFRYYEPEMEEDLFSGNNDDLIHFNDVIMEEDNSDNYLENESEDELYDNHLKNTVSMIDEHGSGFDPSSESSQSSDENSDNNYEWHDEDDIINDTIESKNNQKSYIPLNGDNLNLDHIIDRTYGFSQEFSTALELNDTANEFIADEEAVEEAEIEAGANVGVNNNISETVKDYETKKRERRSRFEKIKEVDYEKYNILKVYELKKDAELSGLTVLMNDINLLVERMKSYDVNVPDLSKYPIRFVNRDKDLEIYNMVREDTLKQARYIGINFMKKAPILFTSENCGYSEDTYDYMTRLFGGYRYHLFRKDDDIKEYDLIYIVFSVVSRIFRSVSQYSNDLNYYKNVLQNLLKLIPVEKRKEDLKTLINNVLSNNIPNQLIRDEANSSDNQELMNEILDGYTIHMEDFTHEQRMQIKYSTLAKCCNDNCVDITITGILVEIVSVFVALQNKSNNIKTLYKIIEFIFNNEIYSLLVSSSKCFSRLRGIILRLKEVRSQLRWMRLFKTSRPGATDYDIQNYKGFSADLVKKLLQNVPMHSNEIDLNKFKNEINQVRNEIEAIKLKMCCYCHRISVNDWKEHAPGSIVYNRILELLEIRDNTIDITTVDDPLEYYRNIDPNHPFVTKKYLCVHCYEATTPRKLENNSNAITKYCFKNMLYVDKVPLELQGLNDFERLLIQKRWLLQSVYAINKINNSVFSHMKCVSGYAISIKVNTQKAFDEILSFRQRKIIIVNKTQYKIRSNNIVDVKKVYDAYRWLIANNRLYQNNVLPNYDNFEAEFIKPQFAYVDDVGAQRGNVFKELSKADLLAIRRRCNRYPTHHRTNEEYDCYDNEKIFKIDGYLKKTEFETFYLESNRAGDENIDAATILRKQHVNINWDDSELDNSQKVYETFPVQFPLARFGHDHDRTIKLTRKEYLKTLLAQANRRYVKEPHLIMGLSKTEQKKDGIGCIRVMGNMRIGETMTMEETLAKSREGQLLRTFRKLKTSDSYWHDVTNRLNVIETYIGPPTWFLTLNPSENDWTELIDAYKLLHNSNDGPFNLKKAIEDDPYIMNIVFEKRLNIILKHLQSDKSVLGKVIVHYYKIEYQQRGHPHVHLLLWTEEGINLDYTNHQSVATFIDKYLTTSCYINNEDEEFSRSVIKDQRHTCKMHYCLKRKGISQSTNNSTKSLQHITTSCRFGYPKDICGKTKVLKISEDVDHLLQLTNKSQKSYIIKRMANERDINQYNPHLKKMWIGNIDLQPNGLSFSAAGAVNYASKYVSKNTLSNNLKAVEYLNTALKTPDLSISSKLFRLMYGINLQTQAYTEVIDIARSADSHYTSLNVIYINTSPVEQRAKYLKKDKNTDVIGVASNMYDDYYFKRPPLLEDVCLFSFFANFNAKNGTINNKPKEKEDFPLNFFNMKFDELEDPLKEKYFSGVSIDRYANIYNLVTNDWSKRHISSPCFEFSRNLSIPVGRNLEEMSRTNTYLVPHKITLLDFFSYMSILEEGHQYISEESEQEVYGRYLRLFYPRRQEIDTSVVNAKELFARYMEKLKRGNPTSYSDILSLIGKCNKFVKKRLASKEFSLYKKDMRDRFKEILDFDNGVLTRLQTRNDGFPDPMSKFGTFDKLLESINMLNTEQARIYNILVEDCVNRFLTLRNDKNATHKPVRLICDGPGGSGKSFLIDVVTAAITVTIRNNLQNHEDKGQVFVLKVTPTGVASVNIQGRTIHNVFSLPVVKSKLKIKMKPLSATAKSKLASILSSVQLLIIDEISMVDASMLYSVSHRINEALNAPPGSLFGNINCLFTGDLLQLPPVKTTFKDAQLFYEEINPTFFEAQYGGGIGPRSAFINFNFVSLYRNNRQKDDQTFLKALNEIRKGIISDDFKNIIKARSFKNLTIAELYFKALAEGFHETVILTPKNDTVDEINYEIVCDFAHRHHYKLFNIRCRDTAMLSQDVYKRVWLRKENYVTATPILDVNLEVLENVLIAYEKKEKRKEKGLHETLSLCRGATVMITRNLDLDKSICNGARGIITDIVFKPNIEEIENVKAVDISEVKVLLNDTGEIVSIPPSWHYFVAGESLGLTLPSAIIHFPINENEKISSTAGLLYVSLSRVKSSKGLYIKELDYEKYNIPNNKNICILDIWEAEEENKTISYVPFME